MAACLKQGGHEVAVYDADRLANGATLSWSAVSGRHGYYLDALEDEAHSVWQEIEATIRAQRPDLVGITALSVKAASAVRVAEICKRIDPGIVTVVGADHPTAFPEQFLKNSNIDFVVRGEGEATIVDLVSCLARDRHRSPTGIPGVSYKKNGRFEHNPDRPPLADLDALPLPALDALLGVEAYRPLDFGAVITSRGCPYTCTFCGVGTVWGTQVRFRSAVKVVDEIEMLNGRFGISYFSFRDASFTLSRQRIFDLCALITERSLDIRWECLTRADLLDEELAQTMAAAGCAVVRLGVESGSQHLLDQMGKDVPLDAVRNAAQILHGIEGMYWTAYILIGTPSETRETVRETIDFLREINPPFITLARYAPIPGTAMYDELAQRGMINPDIDWRYECNQRLSSHYVYALSEEDFSAVLGEVAAFVEAHNEANSARLQQRDYRLK